MPCAARSGELMDGMMLELSSLIGQGAVAIPCAWALLALCFRLAFGACEYCGLVRLVLPVAAGNAREIGAAASHWPAAAGFGRRSSLVVDT